MDMVERFEQFDDEYLEFDLVENKRSNRPDLHAFLLIDSIFPCSRVGRDLIAWAEHDEYGIDVDMEIAEKLTDEQIRELVRCGLRWSEVGGLYFLA